MRDVRTTDRYDGNIIQVDERLRESYPWVTPERGENVDGSELIGTRTALLYTISYNHPHGRTTPYLDGGSGRVVREIQRSDVDRLPTEGREVTSEDGDLLVRIERTRPGGPLGVTAFENATAFDNATTASNNATDRGVNASVAVDGERVGHTQSEWLWTIEPRGEPEVTVTYEGETVTVTL